jgi:lipid II:glycine glycyltransferase (peptidoglycan interpeptide bridge formation enzyme)
MHIEMVKKFGLINKKEDYYQLLRIFREKIKLFVCLVDSEPITALLNYYTPTTAYGAIGPYNLKAKSIQNNTLPMCASIRYACDSGYQYFDMGITQTPSLAAYKEKFGGIRIPLMIYQKKFSPFKMMANKAVSGLPGFGRII